MAPAENPCTPRALYLQQILFACLGHARLSSPVLLTSTRLDCVHTKCLCQMQVRRMGCRPSRCDCEMPYTAQATSYLGPPFLSAFHIFCTYSKSGESIRHSASRFSRLLLRWASTTDCFGRSPSNFHVHVDEGAAVSHGVSQEESYWKSPRSARSLS